MRASIVFAAGRNCLVALYARIGGDGRSGEDVSLCGVDGLLAGKYQSIGVTT